MIAIDWPHVTLLPLGSCAFQLIRVTPSGNGALSGLPSLRVAETLAEQLSPAVGVPGLTIALNWPESVNFAIPAGQVMVGDCTSFTFTVKAQLGPAVVVQVTVVVPTGKVEPLAGTQVVVPHPEPVVGAG